LDIDGFLQSLKVSTWMVSFDAVAVFMYLILM
jgi:hypothetical protein